jgi:hypothetical protein
MPLPFQQVIIAPLSTDEWIAVPIGPVSDLKSALIIRNYDVRNLQNDHQRGKSTDYVESVRDPLPYLEMR